MSLNVLGWLDPYKTTWSKHAKDLATIAPLISGVVAPFSVLLDIPALSEKWYSKNGEPAPDPRASLVLSAISLAFGLIANALLLIRFSTDNSQLRITWMIPLSIACWAIKLTVGLVNLILFGIITRNEPSYSFLEGFWCAVVSVITSGIVFSFLSLHGFISRKIQHSGDHPNRDIHTQVRVSGRHFMLSTTLFLFLVGLTALIMSRLEGWTYLDGIYYSTVTFETIGFGDFSPTHPASQVLIIPLGLIGIASLGSLVQMIVSFFSERSAMRKEKSRAMYERQRQEAEDKKHDPADLNAEIEFLENLNKKQDVKDQAWEFAMSLAGFIIFWIVGAAIFMALEGWGFGISMYFCYVFFLTIGYGDYSPQSPAGKVVFIVYSILAVPIMAAFAVQAVTQVMTRVSNYRLEQRRVQQGVEKGGDKADDEHIISHAEHLAAFHERYDHLPERPQPRNSSSSDTAAAHERMHEAQADDDMHSMQEANTLLLRQMLQNALALEAHARRMLIRHLPNGSKAQVLLKADRNVQLRDLRFLRRSRRRGAGKISSGKAGSPLDRHVIEKGDSAQDAEVLRHGRTLSHNSGSVKQTDEDRGGVVDKWNRLGLDDEEEDADWVSEPLTDEDTFKEVRRYREAFAGLLVAGTRLQKLEGEEMLMLERRRPRLKEM